MTPQQFFDKAWPLCLQASADCNIWPDIIFAQSALETGYGAHAPQNNYFGIKGPGGSAMTTEYVDGHPVKVAQHFAGYPSMALSFTGYAVFITRNERYSKAREWGPKDKAGVRQYFDHEETVYMANQLHAICDAGYATDPHYYDKVASIIKSVPTYRKSHNRIVAKVWRTFAPMPTVYPVAMLKLPPVPIKQDTKPMSDLSKWLGAHAAALTNAANVLKEVAGAVPIPAAQALAGVISGIEGMASNVGAVASSTAASPSALAVPGVAGTIALQPAPQTGVLAVVETDAFNAVIDAEQAAFKDLMSGNTQNIVGDMVQAAEVGAFGTKGTSN